MIFTKDILYYYHPNEILVDKEYRSNHFNPYKNNEGTKIVIEDRN